MAELSVAVALRATLVRSEERRAGDGGRLTLGAVVSLRTVTVTGELVPMLPLESVARAVSVALPSGTEVESQVIEYGAVVSVPTTVEPTRNWTCEMAELSVAVALRATFV